jgi:energy-converting hydrogenase Eha subunit A
MLNALSSNWIDFDQDTLFKYTESMIFTTPIKTANGSSITVILNGKYYLKKAHIIFLIVAGCFVQCPSL